VGLTITLMTVEDAYLQSLLGAFCVGLVMVINYSQKPFIRDIYDSFDALTCVTEVTVFLLGLSLYYRRANATTDDEIASVGTGSTTSCPAPPVHLCCLSQVTAPGPMGRVCPLHYALSPT
jgi:hypothetical protein